MQESISIIAMKSWPVGLILDGSETFYYSKLSTNSGRIEWIIRFLL
jgi:hypothetical protein